MHSNTSKKPLLFPSSFKQSPYILPLNAHTFTKPTPPPYAKQTCYGNWGNSFQESNATRWTLTNEGTRVRTYCSHKTPYESKTTMKFYQPYAIAGKAPGCINPLNLREEANCKKPNTKKGFVLETGGYGKRVPVLDKILPKLQRADKRPLTGGVVRKYSEIVSGQTRIRLQCRCLRKRRGKSGVQE
eukprot:TRINITY_DN4533_c0_g2_i10.p1 TRINITY_DN4533_c0_g2~~TRINITY_DN4533_c0_g2_i10.p1  ORF type:complete len:186 (-),score=25.23 TRINITY_DN4533_c0_g2_i10:238-795(-)